MMGQQAQATVHPVGGGGVGPGKDVGLWSHAVQGRITVSVADLIAERVEHTLVVRRSVRADIGGGGTVPEEHQLTSDPLRQAAPSISAKEADTNITKF